ncbi:MAG: sigma 54-interacting transcriptional regulator [Magnetococcales bacterium]|nr:sigma 54-interacting transcriptional regulator [Magnetococcales bacterium]
MTAALEGLQQEVRILRGMLQGLLATVEEAVFTVDADLVIREANAGMERICHWPPGMAGQRLDALEAPCAPRLARLLEQAMAEHTVIEEVELVCPDAAPPGQGLRVRLGVFPLYDGQGKSAGAAAVIRERSGVSECQPERPTYFHRLVGGAEVMQEVYQLIRDLSRTDTTVLISGESGTGKELVAEALHRESDRQHGPMVKVNCSALSETILESELFGHVKGAFTGAVRDRAGRFELADGGTIFLDEIGDISPAMQTRLLRAIQEREIERVGDARPIRVDVRIVAATNKNLREEVEKGTFREDLYFRLNVVEIPMPPLRERLGDLELLVAHFVAKFNTKYQRSIGGVAPQVMDIFQHHPWPGNVRELENVLEHAFVICRVPLIRVKHLPKSLLLGRPCADPAVIPPAVTSSPAGSEKESILRALEAAHWHKKQAAKLLGVARSTFYRKLEKLGIQ